MDNCPLSEHKKPFPVPYWITCQLATVLWIELFSVNRLSFSWDHDSSEQVSWLMDQKDSCGMCFRDMHISHNFHSQWDKVSEGCTLTCISEPESEMRNRRQIKQLPSDKLTSWNRDGPSTMELSHMTTEGLSLFSTGALTRMFLKTAPVNFLITESLKLAVITQTQYLQHILSGYESLSWGKLH